MCQASPTTLRHPVPWMASLLVVLLCSPWARGQLYSLNLFTGDSAGRLGSSLTTVGDVDLDGRPDYLIGEPLAGIGFGRGAVKLVSGATGSTLFAWGAVDPIEDLGTSVSGTIVNGVPFLVAGAPAASNGGAIDVVRLVPQHLSLGTFPNDHLGTSVAFIGDVNNDFIPDVISGAPDSLPAGSVRIISGLSGLVITTRTSPAGGVHFGASVAGIGDVDQDGIPDFVVGDPDANAGAGRISVVSGASFTFLYSINGAGNEALGTSVAGLGDTNGDGVPDFAVGAPRATVTLPLVGRVRILSGNNGAALLNINGAAFGGVGDQFGFAVAGAGDVNGDGLGDVIIGVPGDDPAGVTNAGQGRVHSGATGALLVAINGTSPGARLGHSVAGGGFLDSDGIPDVLLGGPNLTASPIAGATVSGYSGANGALIRAFGFGSNVSFGTAVAFAGDEDGDGISEVAVGTPASNKVTVFKSQPGPAQDIFGNAQNVSFGAAIAGVGARGRGLVIGDPNASTTVQSNIGGITLTPLGGVHRIHPRSLVPLGLLTISDAGRAVAIVADRDADNVPDVAVGAPLSTVGLTPGGAAVFISGRTGSLIATESSVATGQRMGSAIADVGDVDGDGIGDVALGAPPASFGVGSSGFVRLVQSGGGGPLPFTLSGAAAFGASVSRIGDVDGDGVSDLLAGSPSGSGTLILSPSGRVAVLSGATGSVLWSRTRPSGDGFGTSVAGFGDMNGDGISDVVVGAPLTALVSGNSTQQGFAYLFSGADGTDIATIAGGLVGNAGLINFGQAVAAAGDLDDDGFPDFLIGAPGTQSGDGVVRVMSRYGLPVGTTRFGGPCPVPGGVLPVMTTFGGTPVQGNGNFGLALARAEGGAATLLALGFSSTSWDGVPLPLNVSSLGILGCPLLVSVDMMFLDTATGSGQGEGEAFFPLPIPNVGALAGFVFFAQWYVNDVPGTFQGTLPEALSIQIQQIL